MGHNLWQERHEITINFNIRIEKIFFSTFHNKNSDAIN